MAKTSGSGPKSRGGDASKARRPADQPNDKWSDDALSGKGISANERAKEWLRRNKITPEDVRQLGGGGLADSQISVYTDVGGGIVMAPTHEKLAPGVKRILSKDGGKFQLYNAYFRVKSTETGGGIGRRMLQQQVLAAHRLGISKIKTTAAGELGGAFNGYYSWASLGYNGRVPDSFRRRYRGTPIGRATTTQQLFAIRGGADAWKRHGEGISMTFTVRKSSVGWKMLFEGRKRFE